MMIPVITPVPPALEPVTRDTFIEGADERPAIGRSASTTVAATPRRSSEERRHDE
jgi:hypothetical protein